jgi:hypothetical protein
MMADLVDLPSSVYPGLTLVVLRIYWRMVAWLYGA